MSESLAVGHAQTRPAGRAGDTAGIAALDARRKLQLALGVIWVLDGILAGTASPVNGAPGPVILYAILAVLLWPADRDHDAPSVAERVVGRRPAQAVWLVLWGSLAAFALLPASRAPGAVSGMLTDGADGAPVWFAWIDTHAASALNHHGLTPSIVLAVLLALVAVAVCLPAPVRRAAIVLAVVLAAALWLAQGMGELFTGMATDPESGPLLALLALAFWPAVPTPAVPVKEA
jgi:hypothetical protein